MTTRSARPIPKWPFLFADACLLGVAFYIVEFTPHPLGPWPVAAALAAVALGGGLATWPFVLDHRAALQLSESDKLASVVAQIQQLEQVAAQVTGATARWQTAQDAADKTTAAAQAIAGKINVEARAFQEFLQKNSEGEKSALRLEVEKLQRAQTEWLQLAVRTLDHVFALHQAGQRSGQPALVTQLGQFQHACRDLARRLGLVPFGPQPGEAFDDKGHQLTDPQAAIAPGSTVGMVLAPGYTFQGQLLRKALVTLQGQAAPAEAQEAAPAEAPPGGQQPLL
jgi:molecular chaperone GrpE (heat shock protein)